MTLQELIQAIDALPPEDLRRLREHIQQREQKHGLRAGTMDIDALLQAARAIRADMNEVEFDEMIVAMNEEYIEPTDESGT